MLLRPLFRAPALLGLLSVALFIAGCSLRDANRWPGHKPNKDFAVLVAPVDAGPVDALWKDATNAFAFDLANRIDFLGKDANGWALEDLPRSNDPAWAKPVPAAAGADWIVFTTVLSLEDGPSPIGPQVVAEVEMRAVDQTGRVVFLKHAHGTAPNEQSPKLIADASKPGCKAAWAACVNASEVLLDALRVRQDRLIDGMVPAPVTPAPAPPAPVADVMVTISSVPDHADVLVDGKFRGTTPLALTLPASPVMLRIERQGYRPWEREIVPAKDLQMAPALEPLDPQAQPAPAPTPVKP